MTDIEMTKLCALAAGYFRPQKAQGVNFNGVWASLKEHDPDDNGGVILFNPLTDDAQAMALVKRRCLHIDRGVEHPNHSYPSWRVLGWAEYRGTAMTAWNRDLNRAICECVAKMQANTGAGER